MKKNSKFCELKRRFESGVIFGEPQNIASEKIEVPISVRELTEFFQKSERKNVHVECKKESAMEVVNSASSVISDSKVNIDLIETSNVFSDMLRDDNLRNLEFSHVNSSETDIVISRDNLNCDKDHRMRGLLLGYDIQKDYQLGPSSGTDDALCANAIFYEVESFGAIATYPTARNKLLFYPVEEKERIFVCIESNTGQESVIGASLACKEMMSFKLEDVRIIPVALGTAIVDFQSDAPNDLSFSKGESIILFHKTSDLWSSGLKLGYGNSHYRIGNVPLTFIGDLRY